MAQDYLAATQQQTIAALLQGNRAMQRVFS